MQVKVTLIATADIDLDVDLYDEATNEVERLLKGTVFELDTIEEVNER